MNRRVALVLLVACSGVGLLFAGRGQSANNPQDFTAQSPAEIPAEPTGAERCVFCHRSEVEGFARSLMAHSLRRAGVEPEGEVDTQDAKITMHASPGGYWQTLDADGDRHNFRIAYVIGSGNHASGYLVDLSGHLFQSPVAYYKTRHAYDLAPGYENSRRPDFTWPVGEACLFCHSGRALYVAGTPNQYRRPVFSAEAITCERCHGSAEKHLSDPRAGTIVNPTKLEPAARDSICEQCHLMGVGRVLNPGMKFGDFQPGERLEDVFTTYVAASPPGEAAKFKVISHVEQLARSTCARMSSGRLWCGTCHNPHSNTLEPVEFFRSKCLSCHTGKLSASHPGEQSNCIGCHMPRRNAQDGGHTVFTDHRIQPRPDSSSVLPETSDIAAWRQPAPEFEKRNLGIAYVNVGLERGSPQFIQRGYQMLKEIQQQFNADSEVFTSIGTALLAGKQPLEAEETFERALEFNPNSVTAETNAASAFLQAGDSARAIVHLEHAVMLDPLCLPAESTLIDLYLKEGNTAKAAERSNAWKAAIDGQSAQGDGEKSPVTVRPAEAMFKNLQVLRGIPFAQLIPTMRFISASLGVECNYCHVAGGFDKDDKKTKQIARNMMRMVFAIDKDNFGGSRQITCYSCHRGSPKPEATPVVATPEESKREASSGNLAGKPVINSYSADQLIDRYVQALGGADAIEKITSLVETGTTTQGGQSAAMEVFDQDPNLRTVIRHFAGGDAVTIFNSAEGWSSLPGHPLREMHGDDLDAARIDADLHFPLHIREIFGDERLEDPEQIGERTAYVISCLNVDKPPTRLYFDARTGLLLRLLRYTSSPLGLVPTQIDYSDYREVGGVKAPFRLKVTNPDGSSTTQIKQLQQNVSIDKNKFATPSPSAFEIPRTP